MRKKPRSVAKRAFLRKEPRLAKKRIDKSTRAIAVPQSSTAMRTRPYDVDYLSSLRAKLTRLENKWMELEDNLELYNEAQDDPLHEFHGALDYNEVTDLRALSDRLYVRVFQLRAKVDRVARSLGVPVPGRRGAQQQAAPPSSEAEPVTA